jgi:glucose/mannose-6-phosphate isomerase
MSNQMLQWLEGFPGQIKHAAELGEGWKIEGIDKPSGVAFLGIGGSAIGATLVCDLFADWFTCPVAVQRGDTPPSWSEPGTLAVAISYSGETKETLASFQKALDQGAQCATISSGGTLAQYAEDHNQNHLIIPSGMAPRAALGYTSIPLIYLLREVGAISADLPDFEALVLLETVGLEWRDVTGPGVGIAQRLKRQLPIIVGGGLTAGIARRFQAQLAENSKALSLTFEIPEALHNLIETIGRQDIEAFRPIAVLLDDPDGSYEIRRLMNLTRETFQEAGIETVVIPTQGDSPIERIYSLVHKTDWISYHLAKIRGVDPVAIPMIKSLK